VIGSACDNLELAVGNLMAKGPGLTTVANLGVTLFTLI
jgi:hypothetical protein